MEGADNVKGSNGIENDGDTDEDEDDIEEDDNEDLDVAYDATFDVQAQDGSEHTCECLLLPS